jgi:hypothetical protein
MESGIWSIEVEDAGAGHGSDMSSYEPKILQPCGWLPRLQRIDWEHIGRVEDGHLSMRRRRRRLL